MPAPTLSPSGLAAAVARVQDLVHLTAARGAARAKLQLHPAELGKVDIDLRTTRDGLVARIAAADGTALEALQQAASELRRSLEERGVALVRLDLELAADSRERQPDRAPDGQTRTGRTGAGSVDDIDGAADDVTPTTTTLPADVLVDVQA
jgi:flagellar hook-length control protein FliK